MFHDFSRQENLHITSEEAKRLGVLRYADDNEGVLVVANEAAAEMRSFIERNITE